MTKCDSSTPRGRQWTGLELSDCASECVRRTWSKSVPPPPLPPPLPPLSVFSSSFPSLCFVVFPCRSISALRTLPFCVHDHISVVTYTSSQFLFLRPPRDQQQGVRIHISTPRSLFLITSPPERILVLGCGCESSRQRPLLFGCTHTHSKAPGTSSLKACGGV